MGQIGVHYPREMIRVERDYSGGELVQCAYQRQFHLKATLIPMDRFYSTYPIELEGRVRPFPSPFALHSANEFTNAR